MSSGDITTLFFFKFFETSALAPIKEKSFIFMLLVIVEFIPKKQLLLITVFPAMELPEVNQQLFPTLT